MNNSLYTGSQIVCKGHGFLTDIFASLNDATQYIEVYDGVNDSGKLLFKSYIGADYKINYSPRTFPRFITGLYLKTSGATITVNIGYRNDDK